MLSMGFPSTQQRRKHTFPKIVSSKQYCTMFACVCECECAQSELWAWRCFDGWHLLHFVHYTIRTLQLHTLFFHSVCFTTLSFAYVDVDVDVYVYVRVLVLCLSDAFSVLFNLSPIEKRHKQIESVFRIEHNGKHTHMNTYMNVRASCTYGYLCMYWPTRNKWLW